MKKKKTNFGKLIIEALTEDQLASLLDVLATSGRLTAMINEIEQLEPDLAATVSQILNHPDSKPAGPAGKRIVSRRRLLENWNELWEQWQKIVAEIGDEEGKYAIQDTHWEAPYFDGYYVSEDLEQIAVDMLPLIDHLYDSVDQPDLFKDAIEEIADNIDQYPEWMGAEDGQPCVLGKHATSCVLMWLMNASKKDPVPGMILIEQLCELLETYYTVELDADALVDWFTHISDEIGREVYDHLSQEAYRFDLKDVFSHWHKIYYNLQSRYDMDKFLAACRKYLTDNWRYGRPLAKAAYKRKESRQTESWLEKTFCSYLGITKKKTWHPEDSLLLSKCGFRTDEDAGEIDQLLTLWNKAAGKTGNHPRRAAAKLQAAIVLSPENWDTVIKAFKRLATPQTKETLKPLFDEWKTEMAVRSLPHLQVTEKNQDTWIHWLIEAGLNVRQNQKWFSDQLEHWLNTLEKEGNLFKKQWLWLARLTGDWQGIESRFPIFFQVVIPTDEPFSSILEKSRREGLQKMKVGKLCDPLMRVWQKHLARIVPDPSDAYKSRYTRHANWALALHELNPEACAKLMLHWQKKHKRRRNLWRDLNATGLQI
jgi:hypothetical protein